MNKKNTYKKVKNEKRLESGSKNLENMSSGIMNQNEGTPNVMSVEIIEQNENNPEDMGEEIANRNVETLEIKDSKSVNQNKENPEMLAISVIKQEPAYAGMAKQETQIGTVGKKQNTLKLLICYHKPSMLLKDSVLTPIHVGRSLARKRMDHDSADYKWLMENLTGDDSGENISDKNGYYNEMTAIYWAWKNYETLGNPDYIGLMHYRRHFIFDESITDVINVRNAKEEGYLNFLGYNEDGMSDFVEGYDFIPHMGRVQNVYHHYIQNQRKEDIDLANEIVLEKYPEYKDIMEEYYAGNDSNFCNMCIFRKELFFEYCEWIFSILEEFEKRVDMSEKRFFISERLTGLFVAGLMRREKLRYKKLPIAFLDEPVEVPIAVYTASEKKLDTAVFLRSLLVNKDNYNWYRIFLFCKNKDIQDTEELFVPMIRESDHCTVEILETDKEVEELPLFLEQYLPKVNKCVYVSGKVVAFKDLGEFYRICSVDDYLAVGVPETYYDPAAKEKKITPDLMVLNLKRLRSHGIAGELLKERKNKAEISLNGCLKKEIGYLPDYFFVSEHLANHKSRVLSETQRRSEIQQNVLWHNFMVYDELEPEYNFQGIFSVFWWDIFAGLPLCFQKLEAALIGIQTMCINQQKEIDSFDRQEIERREAENRRLFMQYETNEVQKPWAAEPPQSETEIQERWEAEQAQKQAEEQKNYRANQIQTGTEIQESESSSGAVSEEWRTYGFFGKLKFYYKHNGLKKTIKYGFYKITGKGGNI